MGRFKDGIGPALDLLRETAGLSQSELARRRKKSDQSRLSRVEDGQIPPSSTLIDEYLTHCGNDVEDLAEAFLGPDPPEEALLRRALRALRVGELSPGAEARALKRLHTLRRQLQKEPRTAPDDDPNP